MHILSNQLGWFSYSAPTGPKNERENKLYVIVWHVAFFDCDFAAKMQRTSKTMNAESAELHLPRRRENAECVRTGFLS
jgi:hypothetical protein